MQPSAAKLSAKPFRQLAFVLAAVLLLGLPAAGLGAGRPQGFIVLSAGRDGVIGTPDDVYAMGEGDVVRGTVDLASLGLSEADLVPSSRRNAKESLLAAPAGLRVTGVTSTSVALAWDPVAGAAEYRVYCDGVLAASMRETSAVVGGLFVGTSYRFTVRAVDSRGCEGLESEPVTAVTSIAFSGGRISASGYAYYKYPSYAFDGSFGTWWVPDKLPGWIRYEWPKLVVVSSANAIVVYTSGNKWRLESVKADVFDGSSWFVRNGVSPNYYGEWRTYVISLSGIVAIKWVQVTVYCNEGTNVWEIQFANK